MTRLLLQRWLLMVCLLPWFVMATAQATGPDKPPLVVSQDHAWPPMAFRDASDQPRGLLVDLWQALGEQMNRPVTFRLVDWPDSLEQVREGTAQVHGGLFRSTERARYLDFSKPLLSMETVVFVASDLNISRLDDPAIEPLGVVAGSYEREFLLSNYPELALREYPNNEKLVRAAVAGEVEAFAADLPVGRYLLDQYARVGRFHIEEVLYKQELVAAVARGNTPLLKEINAAIASLPSDELRRITNRWVRTETVEVTPAWLLPTLIAAALVVLLIFIGVYSNALRRQRNRLTQQLEERTCDLQETSEQFQALFENAATAVIVHERDSARALEANSLALGIFAVDSVEELNRVALDTGDIWGDPPYTLKDCLDWFTRVRDQGAQRVEWKFCLNGKTTWVEIFLQNVHIGGVPRIVSTAVDITARKEAEALLQRQLELEELVRSVSLTLFYRHGDEITRTLAQILEKIGEVAGVRRCMLLEHDTQSHHFSLQEQWNEPGIEPHASDFRIPPEVSSPYLERLEQGEAIMVTAQDDSDNLLEQLLFESSGGTRSVLGIPILRTGYLQGALLLSAGEADYEWPESDIKLLQVAADLIGAALDRQQLEQELEIQATRDSLTGLYNRRKLDELLGHEIERAARYKREFTLIMLDIDHFKIINDHYGHDTGDHVLRELSEVLRNHLRGTDILARWGGEEFVIVLPETDAIGGQQLAETLRREVATARFTGVGQITISLGVTGCHPIDTLDGLIRRVDRALYQAKAAGRDCVRVAEMPVALAEDSQ